MESGKNTIKRIGVRLRPPAVIAVYETPDGSLRKMTAPVRELTKTSSARRAAEHVRDGHSAVFGSATVFQIEKMVRIIQENMKGHALQECLETVEKEFTLSPDEDLNKLDDDVLQRKKELMNASFEEHCIKPGDPRFRYDIEDDFDACCAVETSGWDTEREDEEYEFE